MKEHDDNNWQDYTKDYMYQIIQVYRDGCNGFFIERGDKLHPNCNELYSRAEELNPQSILEVGCGGCYNLQNLYYLLPDVMIHGVDISIQQIDFGRWFSDLPEEIDKNLKVMDITKECPKMTYEFVYSQAVVMHQSYDNAMKMMQNMKKISTKYIFMVENPHHHGTNGEWKKMVFNVFGDCDINYESKFGTDCVLITKLQ